MLLGEIQKRGPISSRLQEQPPCRDEKLGAQGRTGVGRQGSPEVRANAQGPLGEELMPSGRLESLVWLRAGNKSGVPWRRWLGEGFEENGGSPKQEVWGRGEDRLEELAR